MNPTDGYCWVYPSVAPSVVGMSLQQPSHRLAYDDADTTAQMHVDAVATAHEMHLAPRRPLAEAAVQAPPSILFEDYQERPKREITITEAAAKLAASLHLHLD